MSLTLRELIAQWGGAVPVIMPVTLPKSRVSAVCDAILRGEVSAPPASVDLDSLRTVLLQSARNNDFSSLTLQDWKHSPFALTGGHGLFEHLTLLQRYLQSLREHNQLRPRILRSLAAQYVENFQPDMQSTVVLGNFMAKHEEHLGAAWRKAHTEYDIFQKQAIARLANLFSTQHAVRAHGIAEIFKSAGIPSAVAHSSLALHALGAALKTMTDNYTRLADIQQVKHIISLTSDGQGGLVFGGKSTLISLLCDALLLPFDNSGRSLPPPDDALRKAVENYLIGQLEDPRLKPARWQGVAEKTKGIMLRWLTEQSLELFLKIVDRVAEGDMHAKRMWENRGIFWRTYLKKNYIDKAWVMLGYEAEDYARQISPRHQQHSLSFGILERSTDVRKHVVLILQIDSVTVVDWSHNGKCHLWFNNNPGAPKFFAPFYDKRQLESNSEDSLTHHHTGSWMKRVATIIYQKTNRWTEFCQ